MWWLQPPVVPVVKAGGGRARWPPKDGDLPAVPITLASGSPAGGGKKCLLMAESSLWDQANRSVSLLPVTHGEWAVLGWAGLYYSVLDCIGLY